MFIRFLRKLLLRIGYSLPRKLQKPFYRPLYDGEPPRESGQIKLRVSDESECFIRFEFVGGCRDGEIYEGALGNIFYWESDHGKIGYQFKVASEADVNATLAREPTGPIAKHSYEIVENRVEDGVRYVKARAV